MQKLALTAAVIVGASLPVAAFARGSRPLFLSGTISAKTPGHATALDVKIQKNAKELYLVVTDAGDGNAADWTDWIDPRFVGPRGEIPLTSLKWKRAKSGWKQVQIDHNVVGGAMLVDGKPVQGIGTHTPSIIVFDIPEGATGFKARVGVDDGGVHQNRGGTIIATVYDQPPPADALDGEAQLHNADHALANLDVAPGLVAQLYESEPSITNPTDLDVDSKGRVWICDVDNYRHHNGNRPAGDRILILEDTDHDGKTDKVTTFYQGTDINAALGVCVIGNKVIVSCSPNIFVFTDDGTGHAAKKELLFTGIGGVQHDHGVHAFTFGPDGKLYFNMGNEGHHISDKNGKPVVSAEGHVVKQSYDYRQGMAFRCNPDGSDFEVLAHNFRNPYEVTVDSFGNLWQSDNDDDGNRSVRINALMLHGNYGYCDEVTYAGWQQPRVGMSGVTYLRHWHQNDPGVIPNLLNTGSGAPCGLCVYEGDLLPPVYRNQIIHTDAGRNVVRAYPVTPDGAGYKASIVDLISSTRDRWFRPDDVAAAPDGSLFVSDWYDPGVGGHGQADLNRGRIFRITIPGHESYTCPTFDFSTPDGAVNALKSPNLDARAQAWLKLNAWGKTAEPALKKLFADANPRFRARALWLLARFDPHFISDALKDSDPDVRVTALRAACELKLDVIPLVRSVVRDRSAAVRRVCAIALRHSKSSEAPGLWAELAEQHTAGDRWEVEALGIGADEQWDSDLAAYLSRVGEKWNTPAGRDVIWRSRAKATSALLARIIADPAVAAADRPRYFRAFDYQNRDDRNPALFSLLAYTGPDQQQVLTLALTQLGNSASADDPRVRKALGTVLVATRGTDDFITLVSRYRLTDQVPGLLDIMLHHAQDNLGAEAARALILLHQADKADAIIHGPDAKASDAILAALVRSNNASALQAVRNLVLDVKTPLPLASSAVAAMGASDKGQRDLMKLVADGKLRHDLDAAAANVLFAAYSGAVRTQAAKYLKPSVALDNKPLPPIRTLVRMTGDAARGKQVFERTCVACHRVGATGIDFGPNLSEIGDKLPKDAIFTAILQPSAAIEFNYEGYLVKLKDGSQNLGLITSQTDSQVNMKLLGGVPATFNKSDISAIDKQPKSLMTEGLAQAMTQQGLVDLVEFLSTCKKH